MEKNIAMSDSIIRLICTDNYLKYFVINIVIINNDFIKKWTACEKRVQNKVINYIILGQ